MSDIDALVADLRAVVEQSTEGTHVPGSPIMRGAVLAERAVKAIESLRVERDAALEVMGNHKCGENVEAAYRRAVEAEARIAELEAAARVPVQGEPNNRENCPGSGGHAGCGTYCIVCALLTVEAE